MPSWVYPRACGGTSSITCRSAGRSGLSPRLRGNLRTARYTSPRHRSIPAPAGEPCRPGTGATLSGVYPRACGGTRSGYWALCNAAGLSPRLRGNRRLRRRSAPKVRSIPAPAGEPHGQGGEPADGQVYPRACGGTDGCTYRLKPCTGLSPRLRGNLAGGPPRPPPVRSIPAPAGEPSCFSLNGLSKKVYPRACGGTLFRRPLVASLAGLSPRLRGNRGLSGHWAARWRSIPAPAGEPQGQYHQTGRQTVYPRACGGTSRKPFRLGSLMGLSPRLRGNHFHQLPAGPFCRSIPAPAGEPSEQSGQSV